MEEPKRAMDPTAIIEAYTARRHLYDGLATKVAGLLKELLALAGIQVHAVTFRVKSVERLHQKLGRPGGKYSRLEDVTDLAGIRIVTYFAPDVDRVAQLVEREFEIDRENSIDKRQLGDPDRFGYSSLHHIIMLGGGRAEHPENSALRGLKAELQTRSLLQHAWAEIEHDLGYRAPVDVPRDVRRRFSQLSGMLEMADSQFADIRNDIDKYRTGVRSKITSEPAKISIDLVSVEEYIRSSPRVHQFDTLIAELDSATLSNHETMTATVVRMCAALGIESILELERGFHAREEALRAFVGAWIKRPQHRQLWRGVSLFYLGYVYASEAEADAAVADYLEAIGLGKRAEHLTKSIREAAKQKGE